MTIGSATDATSSQFGGYGGSATGAVSTAVSETPRFLFTIPWVSRGCADKSGKLIKSEYKLLHSSGTANNSVDALRKVAAIDLECEAVVDTVAGQHTQKGIESRLFIVSKELADKVPELASKLQVEPELKVIDPSLVTKKLADARIGTPVALISSFLECTYSSGAVASGQFEPGGVYPVPLMHFTEEHDGKYWRWVLKSTSTGPSLPEAAQVDVKNACARLNPGEALKSAKPTVDLAPGWVCQVNPKYVPSSAEFGGYKACE